MIRLFIQNVIISLSYKPVNPGGQRETLLFAQQRKQLNTHVGIASGHDSRLHYDPTPIESIGLTRMSGQFDKLRASELYCPNCKNAQPVRERLLLVLPNGELHAYRCTVCGETLGTREVKAPAQNLVLPGTPGLG